MPSFAKIGPLLLIVALAGCASNGSETPTPSASPSGDVATWDQARVTDLAGQLVTAADGVQEQLRKQPSPSVGSGQWASYYRLQQHVRRIRTEARHFDAQLKQGKSRDETQSIFQSLDAFVSDAAENARKIFVHAPLMDSITEAGSVINRIRPYYDPKSFDGRQ